MNKYQEYISSHLTQRELLEQLAEEASELAQASLKLIRACGYSDNPTPVTKEKAFENLCEELNDIHLCFLIYSNIEVKEEVFPKLERWAKRLGYER